MVLGTTLGTLGTTWAPLWAPLKNQWCQWFSATGHPGHHLSTKPRKKEEQGSGAGGHATTARNVYRGFQIKSGAQSAQRLKNQ